MEFNKPIEPFGYEKRARSFIFDVYSIVVPTFPHIGITPHHLQNDEIQNSLRILSTSKSKARILQANLKIQQMRLQSASFNTVIVDVIANGIDKHFLFLGACNLLIKKGLDHGINPVDIIYNKLIKGPPFTNLLFFYFR